MAACCSAGVGDYVRGRRPSGETASAAPGTRRRTEAGQHLSGHGCRGRRRPAATPRRCPDEDAAGADAELAPSVATALSRPDSRPAIVWKRQARRDIVDRLPALEQQPMPVDDGFPIDVMPARALLPLCRCDTRPFQTASFIGSCTSAGSKGLKVVIGRGSGRSGMSS